MIQLHELIPGKDCFVHRYKVSGVERTDRYRFANIENGIIYCTHMGIITSTLFVKEFSKITNGEYLPDWSFEPASRKLTKDSIGHMLARHCNDLRAKDRG